jgi:hypothetical protein
MNRWLHFDKLSANGMQGQGAVFDFMSRLSIDNQLTI